jgi:hypothetical protein
MGWRYRKRLTLFPGLSINIGRRGFSSVSVGARGARYTVGRRGPRVTVGLSRTGLSYTATPHHRHPRPAARRGSIIGGCSPS